MLPLIETKRAEIAALCRRFHVRRLEVFGSAARESDFDPKRSDVDFLVEFTDHAGAGSLGNFFDLKEALEALLGRSVDLLEYQAVRNPYLRAGIDETRLPIYAA